MNLVQKYEDLTPPFSFFCQRRRRKCIECVMILSNAKLLGPPGRLSNFMERHQHLWGEICQKKTPLCKQFDNFLQVPPRGTSILGEVRNREISGVTQQVLCSKLKNSLCKIVAKSQVVTKFNVTKSRLHCTPIFVFEVQKMIFHCLYLNPSIGKIREFYWQATGHQLQQTVILGAFLINFFY